MTLRYSFDNAKWRDIALELNDEGKFALDKSLQLTPGEYECIISVTIVDNDEVRVVWLPIPIAGLRAVPGSNNRRFTVRA